MVRIRYCFYCGKALSRYRATKDHVIPRSKGGSDNHKNIVDACRRCNSEKGNLSLDEWRQVVAFKLGVDATNFYFPGEIAGTDVTSEQYKKQLIRQKAIRDERKSSGLCMRCGKVPAVVNRVDCKSCSVTANKHRAAKKLAGVCAYCSNQNPVIPGTGWCLSCYEKCSKNSKKAALKRKELGLCVKCGKLPACDGQVSCESCAIEGREYHKKNKAACFAHYGYTCTCCLLLFDERFLTLDHVNNDGAEHREEIGNGALYRWAIKNGFPDTLQTHCFNCNMGKSVNGGLCPHKED